MAAALGPAATLLGKVFAMLSAAPVSAYVDSLELGQNSEQIKDKLAHTLGLLHNAQVSDLDHNPGLRRLLPALSRNADQAEDLLDELHYFQIHDRLHGTSYATTKDNFFRHGRNALRHTASSWATCFSCSFSQDDSDSVSSDDDDHGDKLRFHPVTMSRKIKSVLQDMQTQCDSVSNLLGSIPSNSMGVTLHRPQIGSTIIQDTLYGRRDTFEKTVNHIISCERTVFVLPIVGPGGIGKTTFTQHLYNVARLYNDTRAANHFEVRVWVCVSTDFDVFKLTREILCCILPTEKEVSNSAANETTNLDQLQKSIVHHLKSKRFLIVLDDIWKCDGQDQWKTLLAPFTKGETKGSMVLVTTRFPKIAGMVKTVDPLELRGLDCTDFFTFFEACIFGDHKPEQYKDELAGIAGNIANKLKGSPLAAKTVGRLLQKDLSHEHWNGVLQKHEWLKQQNNDDIMPSLKISYDYLPLDLKKCFSYFGLYPEDYMFGRSEMNRLLVAVGVADSVHQVDRNYLEELVDNGFLMKGGYAGHEYYLLHDLMHELCQSVSDECLNISDLDFRADDIPQSIRHLSITIEDKYDENFEEEMCKLRERIYIANLRTLMIFRGYEERVGNILNDFFKEINSLRVLFIVVNSLEHFPHKFSKLIHLQYLKIRSSYDNREMSLPSTLSRFYHLKFLDLNYWHGSSDLPLNFSHLENLRDFRAKSELHSNIRNVGKIKHLHTLKEFHVKKESTGYELREVGALTELEGELIIRGLEHVATKEEAAAAKLMLKRNLKKLALIWDTDQPEIDADILDALQPDSNLRVLTIVSHRGAIGPSWLCLDIWLTSLDTLTLCDISWSTLPPFGKLPNLRELTMKRISGMRQFRCGGAPGKCFLSLKEVWLREMPELEEWLVEPNCHSFPSLEIINCTDCPNIRVMPFSEVSCTSLCDLRVSGCPKMSLPSMHHTSTLTNFVVEGANSERLTYDGNKLFVREYSGALAFHNLYKVEDMSLVHVSHISVLEVMSHLGSLQKLFLAMCEDLVLVPVENGEGIQEDNSSLQSLDIGGCGKLFSRWPLGEAGGGVQTIYPFPASVRKLVAYEEESLKSMALLSNLTSLTHLKLYKCSNLTVDGFNPLIALNLKSLEVLGCNTLAADLLTEVARTKLLPSGHISRLETLLVDDISGLLVAPICNLLAPALHTLGFSSNNRAESFTEEQEKALQLLTSLQKLEFSDCSGLQSLPQGLHRLSSLKDLSVFDCPKLQSLPKEGFPVSLRELWIHPSTAEMVEQYEKIKSTNPDLTVIDLLLAPTFVLPLLLLERAPPALTSGSAHPHTLTLVRWLQYHECDGCNKQLGADEAWYTPCDFDLHRPCALAQSTLAHPRFGGRAFTFFTSPGAGNSRI